MPAEIINLTRTEVLTSEGLDPHDARETCSHDMNEPRPNNNYSGRDLLRITMIANNRIHSLLVSSRE